ncbi:zinc finger protein 239-like [Periplaneta americana]|uniref:zinc finger protein 239-like n=1 Tax=Periplaneta americana TaxID=6978 RepID=UPI0037E8C616
MDWIKMEPEVDPLDSQPHDNTYKTEENNDLSEERNLLDLQATGMKTEYVDHSYDLKSQIKDEDSSVPNIFPVMKCEVEEDLFDLDKVQQEQKEEVSSEGDEVLTESVVDKEKTELPACESIVHEEKLAQCPSFRLDSTIGCDIIHSPIKCDICNEDFLSSQSLERHFRTHTLKKSFKCDVCGKSYTHTGSLKIHARLHTGEMPFECDVCRKSFRHLGHLKIHERIHTGERPFKCDMCGKSFPESGRLKKHVLIHTGERPFKCDMCGKCFSEKGSLMKHIRIHTGDRPFKCDMCGKCFTQSSSLKHHSLIHSDERP